MDSLPKRKQNRLTGYDYSQPGCYFVTICSRDREHLFGCVVGADVLIGPHVQLSEIGAIVEQTISQIPSVREFATKIQHQIAEKYNVVMEGRDIGTVVLPNANYKFFLTASLKVRAKRRMMQLDLPQNKFKEVMKEIEERDFRDINRKISPLKRAVDAIFIDNSNQSLEETVEEIFSYIKLT